MQVTVLSPHRDDAAFSCGLLLHALVGVHTRITIVNVCTVSGYAPYLDAGLGDRTERVTTARRYEDDRFVQLLTRDVRAPQPSVQTVDLGWHDLPLRWDTHDEAALEPSSLPQDELESLQEAFKALPAADIVVTPMAQGGHLDHRLVAEAARQAFSPCSLVFYEDLPYACMPEMHKNRLPEFESNASPQPVCLPPRATAAGLKRMHCLCYPSQIRPELADRMEDYSAALGGRERYAAHGEALERLLGHLAEVHIS